ncbi:NUDIX hydrolase [Candidatus Pacearchaeota archaeon]|nr:NUDIX hydrolase [Candidatus Pacearchaeota archaeon]
MKNDDFKIILVGIIFDPAERKILIGRREKDQNIPQLTWCFPGGKLRNGDKVDQTFKKKIKEKTGYDVKNLGAIYARIYPKREDFLEIYFLAEAFKGDMKAGDDIIELKWVKPEEVQKHFTTPFDSRVKEYIMHLK